MTDQALDLNALLQPRMVDQYMQHIPHPVQQIAMSLTHEELLFGGAAGGGKSDWALMTALQYVDVPGYSALVLRRTWPDLNAPGAVLQRFTEWMAPHLADKSVRRMDQGRLWKFPSGAQIQFGYAARDDDKYKYQGAEYQTIIFDEGTQFESSIYEYLLSRLRRPQIQCIVCNRPLKLTRRVDRDRPYFQHAEYTPVCRNPVPDEAVIAQYPQAPDGMTIFDVPLRMRITANPGGKSHLYFRDRFINPKTRKDHCVFIPSALKDNPSLDAETYRRQLENLSAVDRERLLNGDWEVMDEGALFDRGSFQVLTTPVNEDDVKRRVRAWDFAASDGKKSDFTVGAKVALMKDGRLVIEDLIRVQYLPPQVENLVRETAEKDGISVKIYAEQEPGSAGKTVANYLARHILGGYQFQAIRATGSKEDRAGAFVSQADAKNVWIREARWNTDLMDEASLFPNGAHDDQVDAIALAINTLLVSDKRKIRIVV